MSPPPQNKQTEMIIEELDEAVDALKEFGGEDKSLHIDSILNEQKDDLLNSWMNHSR